MVLNLAIVDIFGICILCTCRWCYAYTQTTSETLN